MKRSLAASAFVVWVALLPPRVWPQGPTEYEVKAAFLLNFTKFIEWPASAFVSADAPFRICILGPDPFGASLERMVEGERVSGRPLAVERARNAASCQIVFFGKEDRVAPDALAKIPAGVLTVGEQESFLREGGMIRFVLEQNRVRFDVNHAAVRKAELSISSKLLNVARSVKE